MPALCGCVFFFACPVPAHFPQACPSRLFFQGPLIAPLPSSPFLRPSPPRAPRPRHTACCPAGMQPLLPPAAPAFQSGISELLPLWPRLFFAPFLFSRRSFGASPCLSPFSRRIFPALFHTLLPRLQLRLPSLPTPSAPSSSHQIRHISFPFSPTHKKRAHASFPMRAPVFSLCSAPRLGPGSWLPHSGALLPALQPQASAAHGARAARGIGLLDGGIVLGQRL